MNIALTSCLGDSCTSEHMSCIMHSLCMVLTLVLVQNGAVERKSSIMDELYIDLTSFLGDSCTSEHMGSIRHFYAWY